MLACHVKGFYVFCAFMCHLYKVFLTEFLFFYTVLRSFVLRSCTFTGFQLSMILNCSLGPPGTVNLGSNLLAYQTLQVANCSILEHCPTPFKYGHNFTTAWTLEPLCAYHNNTMEYKWSFVAFSLPCLLLKVPCGEHGITGLSHQGQ